MPLLDSFKVDHTKMRAPFVRIAKTMQTPKGDAITVYDLRFTQPNQALMPEKGIHTLEHLFAGFMRDHLNGTEVEIIDISPMGCRTGFYMSVIGQPSEAAIIAAWQTAMQDVLAVKSQAEIPELNIYQCGTYTMHSLDEAKQIAQTILQQGITVCHNAAIMLSEEQLKQLQQLDSDNEVLPFKPFTPNETTLAAIREAEADEGEIVTIEELMEIVRKAREE